VSLWKGWIARLESVLLLLSFNARTFNGQASPIAIPATQVRSLGQAGMRTVCRISQRAFTSRVLDSEEAIKKSVDS